MAKPRVFVSSTFFDLRQVREDLDRFISEVGYDAVLNEEGDIPYGKDDPPESYAYREIELCDILLSIIGGRYGTESQDDVGYSISQSELKKALESGIPVYIFIEQNVLAEFATYQLNKDKKNVKYKFVDDVRIYEFIDSVHKLPRNNPIAPFRTSADIIDYVKSQWAGLFQRFLQEQKRLGEIKVLDEMKAVAGTLVQLVGFLTEEKKDKDSAIQQILLGNHPIFRRFQEITATSYRVYFVSESELNRWLRARNWKPMEEEPLDEDSFREWTNKGKPGYIKLTEEVFDELGNLKVYSDNNWNDDWLKFVDPEVVKKGVEDLPF